MDDMESRNSRNSRSSDDDDSSDLGSDSISVSNRDEEMGPPSVPNIDEESGSDCDLNDIYRNDDDDEEIFDDENEKSEFEELYRAAGEGTDNSHLPGNMKFPWNAFIFSMVLIGIGGAFLREGILVLLNIHGTGDILSPSDRQELEDTYSAWHSFPYILYSIMLLVPGVYHFVIIILASGNLYGFSYDMVPFYESGIDEEVMSKYKIPRSKSTTPIPTTMVTDNSSRFMTVDKTLDSQTKKTD